MKSITGIKAAKLLGSPVYTANISANMQAGSQDYQYIFGEL